MLKIEKHKVQNQILNKLEKKNYGIHNNKF
jgi:hypothetical protein